MPKPKITPCLWFNKQALEAAKFYVSVFRKNSRITHVSRYPVSGAKVVRQPAGSVMLVTFTLGGQEFLALNGGPGFNFSYATSFTVNCANQKEVDYFSSRLSRGGRVEMCGWVRDRYGLSWQITPVGFEKMMMSRDKRKVDRAFGAMLKMKKLDLKKLKAAFDGR
jgi:predicted 3-demethylubiquinone-9 3-methyltransferase (glyoxalase superfamily)